MPLLVIGESSDETLRLEVGVSSRDLGRVALGGTATVRLDGETVDRPATVVELAPTLTPGTDRVAVTLSVQGPSPTGSPAATRVSAAPRGLVGTAIFPPRSDITLQAIPLTTLVEGIGMDATVWLPDAARAGQVVAKKVVVARMRADGMVLIASGLDGVSEVIDAGNAWLDADALITIKPAATSGAAAGTPTTAQEKRHEDL